MNKKNIFLAFIFIAFTVSFFGFYPQENKEEDEIKKAKIIFREIGNQLLLSENDSISLILPIKKIDVNKYQIVFQNKLEIEPDILVKIIKHNLEKTNFSKNYIVEVLQCVDNEVAYSFEINKKEAATLVPCSGRKLPKSCYVIEIHFITTNKAQGNLLFYIIIPLILVFVYWNYNQTKKKKDLDLDDLKANITLGSFIFYPEQNMLVKQAKEIALSKKECELLEIFIRNKNKVVKREELTKRVWEDNGVVVGRSLDTYISKLRKKLKEDVTIKLTNIHGIGYKLEVTN